MSEPRSRFGKRVDAIRRLLAEYRNGQPPSAREALAAQLVERELPWLIEQLKRTTPTGEEEE